MSMKIVIGEDALREVIDWYRICKPYPRSLVLGRLEELISNAKQARQKNLKVGTLPDWMEDMRVAVRAQGFEEGYKTGLKGDRRKRDRRRDHRTYRIPASLERRSRAGGRRES